MKRHKLKCKLYRIKYKLLIPFNEWRYKKVFDAFIAVDPYFPRESLDKACKHTKTWAKMKREEASCAETYRQKMLGLKMFLCMSGFDSDAIEQSVQMDTVMGVNAFESVISQNIGQEIVDYIIEAGLVDAVERKLFVWSGNAPSQIRAKIIELLAEGKAADAAGDEAEK